MASQLSSCLLSSTPAMPAAGEQEDMKRHTADFHPSVWGDYFLNVSQDTQKLNAWTKRFEELKEEVKSLMRDVKDSEQEIELINDLQRLGVAYQFEKEIEAALQRIYVSYSSIGYNDLSIVALRFRLLRQEGYDASPGWNMAEETFGKRSPWEPREICGKAAVHVFIKFKDDNGHFNKSLSSDARGMLSLYEAAYLGTHGEDILDEAIAFTSEHLKASMPHLDHHLARQVGRALELPLWKRIQRIEIRDYISVYEDDVSRNNLLVELAKLDFNILQSLHQEELRQISKWWQGIDVAKKLHYARDRVAELYLWILAIYFEPKYSRARLIMTKMIGLFSLIDDTYDAYGTLEELEPFTNIIQRWDVGAKNRLPDYMQVLFQAILDTMDEIAGLLTPEERSYRIRYLRESLKAMTKGYFIEQKWFSSGYVPPLDEYLLTALITCGYYALTICSLGGMGELATKEAFEWAMQFPKIVKASSVVNRMLDDIQSREFEQKRGHVASGIDCYVKEYGVSEEEACNIFREMVTAAWKDINEEWLKSSTDVPKAVLIRPIYLACVMEVLFMHADEYTHSTGETKAKITAVLVQPIPL